MKRSTSTKRIFTNSSYKWRRIDTKLSHIADTTLGLNLSGAICAKTPLPIDE